MNALEVDVADLKPSKDNPRRNLGELAELVVSVKAVGILEPLIVTKNGAGYEVVVGHRRLAAAKKAGLKKVPVVVREFDDVGRAEAMLIENLQRTDLAPLEEASAFQSLVETHGYSQRKIAERIGRNQSHVSKRLRLLQLTPKAREALDAGGITVEQGLELGRLAEHPVAMDRVVKDGVRIDSWRVDRALEDVARDQKIAATTAELQFSGTKIVGQTIGTYGGVRFAGAAVRVTTDDTYSYDAHVNMTPAAHAKQPCHAAAIDQRTGASFEVCTSPKTHGKLYAHDGGTSTKGPLTDKDKDARKAKRAHNAALREAQERRWEFLRAGFKTRLRADLKDRALRLLVDAWCHRETGVPYHKIGISACELLGIAPKVEKYGGANPRAAVLKYAAANPDQVLRVALAVGIGAVEDGIRPDVGYRIRPDVGYSGPSAWAIARPYFAWLAELEYEVSQAERLELAGKAPR